MSEIEEQKLLVDSVLSTVEKETIEGWAYLTEEDYWYGLATGAEYLTDEIAENEE